MLKLTAALTACMLLAACGPREEDPVELSDRPSAETMIVRYTDLIEELVTALDAEFGARPWGPRPLRDDIGFAFCSDDDGLEDYFRVFLPSWIMESRYDADPAPVVDPILEKHGFTVLSEGVGDTTKIRRATGEYDAEFELLEGRGTVMAIKTGCHRAEAPLKEFVPPWKQQASPSTDAS